MPDPIVMLKAALLAAAAAWVIASGMAWTLGRRGRLAPAANGPTGEAGGAGVQNPIAVPSELSLGAAGAIAAAVGILVGVWGLGLLPRIPPREAIDRVLVLLVPAAAIAESLPGLRVRTAARSVVAMLAAPMLVQGSSYVADLAGPGTREWSPGLTAALYGGLAAALFIVWTLVTRSAERSSRPVPWAVPFAIAGTTAGAGIVVMLSGYAAGGQLGVPLAAAGAALPFVPGSSGRRIAAAGVGVALVGLFGLLLVARLFAGLTTLNGLLLFAAPLLMGLPERGPIGRLGPRARAALLVTLTAIPVAATLVLAQQKFVADSASSSAAPGEPSLNDYY